ncbi:MAG: ribonuclease H-like domain-containing protein [Dehalococcoidales bacterium]|nr:ribonuclease H-like domain-containing protein [Dehalococcoidales bacterium]
MDAYLDIETTGLSCQSSYITVIGIYLVNGCNSRLIQLVGNDATADNLLESINRVTNLYTYNGSRFDLPFIYGSIGINLESMTSHRDLMYDCWRCNLKGGFKAVEQKLGISRESIGITGWDAVLLWNKYVRCGDLDALQTLLKYNGEDVINLKILREKLEDFPFLD